MKELCTRCPLSDVGASNCIGGIGKGSVLIVGQNPGAEEDLAGTPFIGPSGKLLKAMLSDAGFKPEDVRLTNAVRCRTPKNRPPEHEELLACRDHLKAEIARTKPMVIVALGDHALSSLTGLSGISGKRGQPVPLHAHFGASIEVYPTWHPAFVLRRPMARATVVSDLRRVRDRDKEQEVIKWMSDRYSVARGLPIAYDIETYDEAGAITEAMTQIAIASDDIGYVSRDREHAARIVQKLHDYHPLVSHFGWDFDDKRTGLFSDYDTAALAYLDDETQPLGLESLCVKYLGVRGWKEARDGARLGTNALREYNARDSILTLRVFSLFYKKLSEEKTRHGGVPRLRVAQEILRPLRSALDECSRRGVYVDAQAVALEKVKQEVRVAETRTRVVDAAERVLPPGAFDKQLKTKVRHVPFNPGSTDHVAKVLRTLGYTLPRTPKGKWKTDAETLERLAHPFAAAEIEWREATKRMSTYILPYERAAQSESGRIFTQYTVIRTLTGRTSSRKGDIDDRVATNTQNLDRELKGFFSAAPGNVLVRADYEQLEFWVAVWMAKIDRLIQLRADQPGFDPHRWFASRLYDVSEEEVMAEAKRKKAEGDPNSMRQIAKSADFALLYQGREQTLIDYAAGYGIMLSWKEAHRIVNAFHEAYPEFEQWWGRVKAEMTEYGYVESPTGRRRHTGDVSLLRAGDAFNDAWREATNALVQGFSTGDIAELGLIHSHRMGLPIVGFIHDEVPYEYGATRVAFDRSGVEAEITEALIDRPLQTLREQFNVDFPRHLLAIDFTYKGLDAHTPQLVH